ncbi:MAG: hypothetical protein U1A24_09145 [Cypionkella sp.]|uniref:hypothetical protein n=1 Tax=Cypionkella sp. TaxID=2811411 RepID=UPI002ABA4163|nr:hypothetical protein [Cypionkella sp.]MDZ4310707.1 hypothetical protein [Cypionkella sp.]MDZ4395394.1 hypothetical protein [Cypionkella sp.]
MSLLPRLIHLLVAIALVAVLGTASGSPSGSGCVKASGVEMCIDPALRAGAETSGDPLGKKCFDAILLADVTFGLDGGCVAVSDHLTLAKPMPTQVPPWKPPRVSV